MTKEEAIKGLNELRKWRELPYCIEEPNGEEGVAVITRKALDMAISALKDRPKGEWELFGFPTSDDILYCQEEFICSECRDFKVNRYMRATYNFCPNCGADMRGVSE